MNPSLHFCNKAAPFIHENSFAGRTPQRLRHPSGVQSAHRAGVSIFVGQPAGYFTVFYAAHWAGVTTKRSVLRCCLLRMRFLTHRKAFCEKSSHTHKWRLPTPFNVHHMPLLEPSQTARGSVNIGRDLIFAGVCHSGVSNGPYGDGRSPSALRYSWPTKAAQAET